MKSLMKTSLISALILCVLTGCSAGKQTTVSVQVITSDTTLVGTQITLSTGNPTAAQAVIEACKSNNTAYTLKSGMFDGFGGMLSTLDDGWLLYINGELAQTGAETTPVNENDIVEFRYVNYNEAFKEPTNNYWGRWRSGMEPDGSAAFLTLDEDEAVFTYIDQNAATTSCTGTYIISNSEITINDTVSDSPVKIPFTIENDKMIISYNAKQIALSRQE